MSPVMQWLIIAPLVAGAALFAGWRLLASRTRWQLLSWLLRCLPTGSSGSLARLRSAAQERLARENASGCEACSRR